MDFSTKAYGKWILAGEHSVLRGVPALVFPLLSRYLQLDYQKDLSCKLEIQLAGKNGRELELLVWGVLERACQNLKISRDSLSGRLLIQSSVPVGAGMGASATICVAITRWLGYLGYVEEAQYYDFARELENLFHGESSGVDVAVALSGQALFFVRGGERTSFQPRWQPHWYVSYSGQRGVTADCVSKVKSLIEQNPEMGHKIDEQMKSAVLMAKDSLESEYSQEAEKKLYKALEIGRLCFEQWGLTDGELGNHMKSLASLGAIAVKPTGSGGGGFVLSIWSEPPVSMESIELISCR